MILLRLGRAKIEWNSENNHFKDVNRMDGMPTEFEWKMFPGITALPREDSKSNDRLTV